MKKSILNLLGFNIEHLPDNSFTEGPSAVNSKGILIKKYSKDFDDQTYRIFNKIEVIDFGSCRNVAFIRRDSKEIYIDGVYKLINDLNKFYGPDSLNRGEFSLEDFKKIKNKNLELHEIRKWDELDTKFEPVIISAIWFINNITFIVYNVGVLKNKAASHVN